MANPLYFYNDISSYILYNGHFSNVFEIQRGVRQGDPLSPYLLILCVELLSAALKAHPEIQGLVINNSEYLISQYADDSYLILEDDKKSLNMALHIIDYFAGCSGLRANFDKTQVLWFGEKLHLLYVFPCVILFLCFSVLLVLRLPRLGKREQILVLFVRLFGLCLFRFVGFLFLLGSEKGCGL